MIQNICFPREHKPFPKKIHYSPKEVPFSWGNLGPSQRKFIAPMEFVFFTMELFLFHGEFTWDWHLIFFSLGKLLPKDN
jgi:hypothetical protein